MANDSYTQQALAADPNFRLRVQNAISTVAWQVLNEPADTPGHTTRAEFARQVINNLPLAAQSAAGWLVDRPNVLQFDTTFDFKARAVVTASGDPDIESQLHSDWNTLAGVVLP
jgi:hypothetical protein